MIKQSVRWKLTLFVACVVALTAGALSVASYVFARQTLRKQIHDRLSVVAADRQKLLLGFIQQQEERVWFVASRARLRELLEERHRGAITEEAFREQATAILRDAQHGCADCRAIWLADADGIAVAATHDKDLGRDQSRSPDFSEGIHGAHVRLFHDAEGSDRAVLSAPVGVGNGRPLGVVMMLVDAEPIMDLLADRTGLGHSGQVRVGMRAGDQIRYLLMSEAGTQTLEVSPASAPAMAAATAGESGFRQTRDWTGAQVLVAYRPVGYRDWGVETKIDVAEAYAPVAWLRRLFIAVEVVVMVVGIGFSYWWARRFTRPILRMAAMAEEMAAGGLHDRAPVESSDEVGRLAEAFNKMSEELAHSHAILEERVKQRTTELAAERDLLQQLMDQSPDRIYFKDLQSRFVRANKALAGFFCVNDPAKLIGKTDFDIFSHEHAQQAFDDEQRIIRTGQPIVGKEEKETWPNGTITWCSSTKAPLRDRAGNIVGTFGISRDITDRRRAEEQLNRYFTLSPDLFCIADYAGYFRRVNPAWSAVLGYSDRELCTRPFIEFVHPDDRAATRAEFEGNQANRRTIQFENRYRAKDGHYRWLQWNAIPVSDEQLIYAVARDVTADKNAQELLAGYAEALNKKNQEMQEDLKLAREVHQIFIPQAYPVLPPAAVPERSAVRFHHRYLPTSALGGDFFEIVPLSNTRVGVFICDVMGHGMRAALVTSILRGFIDKYRERADEPDRLLTSINQALLSNLESVTTTIFATAAYLVVDAGCGEVRAANAGHPSPLVLRPNAKTVEVLDGQTPANGPAMGLVRDAVYPVARVSLSVGDSLLLFTDGLFEVEDQDGRQFGLERLVNEVRRRVTTPAAQLVDELVVATRRHAVAGEFTDDVCVVEVELAAKLAG
jgi:sigma-B regulation protein RsbU (phosphoserine phosphatase)